MVPLILVAGYALGADPRRLAVLGLAVLFPPVVVVAAVLSVWGGTNRSDSRPALFCTGVAAELRAGASLRGAVSEAALAVGALSVSAAARGPLPAMARSAGAEFPGIARELELTINRAVFSGAAVADLLEEVGSLALAQEELKRELRVAGAPARAAMAVFVASPAVYLAWRWSTGGLGAMFADPGQLILASAGTGLFLIGVAVALFLVWRSR